MSLAKIKIVYAATRMIQPSCALSKLIATILLAGAIVTMAFRPSTPRCYWLKLIRRLKRTKALTMRTPLCVKMVLGVAIRKRVK
ncbi:MAG: hypothetical protein ACKO96_43110, partial [Flammeovirgaceae bacterium]